MELGGNIELIGFSEEDVNDLIVVKKIVGRYTKKISERFEHFESLKITTKGVGTRKHEVKGHLLLKKGELDASSTDENLYFALDHVLRSLEEQAMKKAGK